jgi:hypothetical protein
MLHARQNRVVLEKISIVRRRACWAPAVMLARISAELNRNTLIMKEYTLPISLIENNNLVSAWRERNLLLCKGFDFIPDNVNTAESYL